MKQASYFSGFNRLEFRLCEPLLTSQPDVSIYSCCKRHVEQIASGCRIHRGSDSGFGGEVDQSWRPRPKLNLAGLSCWPSHLQGVFTSYAPFVFTFVDWCQLRRGWTPSRRQCTELDSLCCCFLEISSSCSVWFGLRPELLLSKTTIPASVRGLIMVHSSYLRLFL